jgi:hypothetical protein
MSVRLAAAFVGGLLSVAGPSRADEPPRRPPVQPTTVSAPASASASSAASAPSGLITYAGGDGTSMEQAVVVLGASNSFAGIRAEYHWLQARFPGYKRRSQALLRSGGKSYDRVEVELPDGGIASFYFDITAFFGKY